MRGEEEFDLLEYERAAWAADSLLIGVDEVGRGPLAGPVVAAAVAFPFNHCGIEGVKDSKRIKSRGKRESLAELIGSGALALGIGAASVREIARLNIRRATTLAMHRALIKCNSMLGDQVSRSVLIDGNPIAELGWEHKSLVKGDAKCHAIAAAAIVAKVTRDRLMAALALRWPGYSWDTNSGYGSAAHICALSEIGITPHHRKKFCQTALGRNATSGF